MTMTWQTMIDFVPPILACVISDQNFTFQILKRTKECVLNIPTVDQLKEVVQVGNSTGKNVDKFQKFQLPFEAAARVQAPLLTDCYANLECRVIDSKMAKKYNLFILEVVKAWIRPTKKRARMIHHSGKGVFIVDGKVIKTSSKKK